MTPMAREVPYRSAGAHHIAPYHYTGMDVYDEAAGHVARFQWMGRSATCVERLDAERAALLAALNAGGPRREAALRECRAMGRDRR